MRPASPSQRPEGVGVAVPGAGGAKVFAEGVEVRAPKGTRTAAAALAGDDSNRQVPVEGGDVEAGHLAQSHPGVGEEADERGVAAFLEPGTFAGVDQSAQVGLAEHGHGLLGDLRWPHLRHRRALELVGVDQPAEELLQVAVGLGDGCGLAAGEHLAEERFEVLAGEVGDGGGGTTGAEKCQQLVAGGLIGDDGAVGEVERDEVLAPVG